MPWYKVENILKLVLLTTTTTIIFLFEDSKSVKKNACHQSKTEMCWILFQRIFEMMNVNFCFSHNIFVKKLRHRYSAIFCKVTNKTLIPRPNLMCGCHITWRERDKKGWLRHVNKVRIWHYNILKTIFKSTAIYINKKVNNNWDNNDSIIFKTYINVIHP